MTENEEIRSQDVTVQKTHEYVEWQAFWSERTDSPHAVKWRSKNKRMEKRGKLINYAKAAPQIQKELDEARVAEWAKWQKYEAVTVISANEAARLRAEGAEEIGTQWIEIDKNEHLRTSAKNATTIPRKLKSRLVALGNQEKAELRSDSPTADTEAVHLVFSFAASRRLKVKSGDLENAYFLA